MLGYVSLVYMFLADWIFFTLDISYMQLAGIFICVACSIAVVVHKMSLPTEEDEENAEKEEKEEKSADVTSVREFACDDYEISRALNQ